ncbi:MAG: methyltransferase domain-containing protein [Phycisphaerae bacterium]|nr:methyltransferase domain-containing protein [Phycisphaerae bacterium]
MTRDSKHTVQVRDYFDDRVADYDAFYDPPSHFARWFNRVFRKAVYLRRDLALKAARAHGCRTMLDVGCGSGQNSVYFARHGVEHVFGVDISSEMIKLARELAERAGVAEQCEFEQLDFMKMAPGAKYDAVVACGVFDYVERAEQFLAHMARFANRVIYGSFPGWTLVRTPLRKLRYTFRGCPTHFYRRRELIRLFENVGFGRIEIQPVPSGYLAWAVREA